MVVETGREWEIKGERRGEWEKLAQEERGKEREKEGPAKRQHLGTTSSTHPENSHRLS